MIVVDVPFDVMARFVRWLYTPNKDTFQHDFTTMTDILHVWQWTKNHLRNAEFRDGLVNEMVKLIATLTGLRGPDQAAIELIRALHTLKCDVEDAMARFLVEWYLSCSFEDAAICKEFSAVLTVNGPHPGLCQAFIQAKLQEGTVPSAGPQQKLPSQLASHPAHQQSDFSSEPDSQKHSEPAPTVQDQTVGNELPAQKDKNAWKYKTDVNVELLKYMESPEEDFTNMTGAERNTRRLRLRRRMRKSGVGPKTDFSMADKIVVKAKGLQDSKGGWQEDNDPLGRGGLPPADDNGDSDSESIAVAATPAPTTRSSMVHCAVHRRTTC